MQKASLILFVTALLFFLMTSFANAENASLSKRLDKCIPYKEQIVSLIKDEGVSEDYFYLAACESSCKVKESPKGARGFYQLIMPTYLKFKPAQCTREDIDDIYCNVTASMRYIKSLQKRFNTMEEVIYAYNMGGHNYKRVGKPTKEAKGLYWCVSTLIKDNKNK